METITKRYYMGVLGARDIGKTYDEAIREARAYLASHPDCEERIIVEFASVVRRERTPIVVKKVRRG